MKLIFLIAVALVCGGMLACMVASAIKDARRGSFFSTGVVVWALLVFLLIAFIFIHRNIG